MPEKPACALAAPTIYDGKTSRISVQLRISTQFCPPVSELGRFLARYYNRFGAKSPQWIWFGQGLGDIDGSFSILFCCIGN